MFNLTKALAVISALAVAQVALADDVKTPATGDATKTQPAAPGADVSMGKPSDGGIGSTYTQQTSGDWAVQCVHTKDGKDPCQLYQLLKDDKNNSVAEINIFGLPAGGAAAAGATVVAPLETLLTKDVTLQIDALPSKVYPFAFCTQVGCISRVGFTADEVAAMKKGQKIAVTITPVAAPDKPVNLTISLKGFTAGYDAVNKANGN